MANIKYVAKRQPQPIFSLFISVFDSFSKIMILIFVIQNQRHGEILNGLINIIPYTNIVITYVEYI